MRWHKLIISSTFGRKKNLDILKRTKILFFEELKFLRHSSIFTKKFMRKSLESAGTNTRKNSCNLYVIQEFHELCPKLSISCFRGSSGNSQLISVIPSRLFSPKFPKFQHSVALL